MIHTYEYIPHYGWLGAAYVREAKEV